ncbi:MAG: hypothetical protein LBV79_04200 [Candidatus Adiutrix sp.]|nr:hypothetical protein [Candidatus Adiutrix sp.]
MNEIQRDAALKGARWGGQTSLTGALSRRSERLEEALADLARLRAWADCRDGCLGGARLASVRPLAALNRPITAVAAFESVPAGRAAAPNAVILAAAGAALEAREPRKAAELYQRMVDRHAAGRLAVSEDELYEAEKGLFWAHLDADELGAAREQARKNYAQGTIEPPEGRALWGAGDWKRTDARVALGLSEIYTGRPAAGERIFSEMLAQAPANVAALSGLSAAKTARGLPRAAWENALAARLHAPDDLGAAVRLAHSLMDARRWAEAHEIIQALGPWAAQSRAVSQLARRWELFKKFEARASFGFAHTSNRNSVSSTNPEDPNIELRLYSPPLGYHWRAFIGSAWDSGRYAEGEGEREMFLGGLQYRGPGLEFSLEARDERLNGRRLGAGLEGLWQPGDHWRVPFSVQKNSRAAPLRAVNSNIRADSASLGLGYYWHESRALNFNAQMMNFTDGNRRAAFSGNFSQRLWAGGHRTVTGRLNAYTSSNSEDDNRPYYNPKKDAEAGLGLTYANLLWRGEGKSLSHALEADASRYRQENYGTETIWTLGYHQSLDWADSFSASYGASYGHRVYDGEPEKNINGYINFVWKF